MKKLPLHTCIWWCGRAIQLHGEVKAFEMVSACCDQELSNLPHYVSSKRLIMLSCHMARKPSPSFDRDKEIKEEWLSNTDAERKTVRAKECAWVVSRMHGDREGRSVPAWRTLREAISSVDPLPVTTAGMPPILHAPVDGNDTHYCNQSLYGHFKLVHACTVITVDQPLYSRGKELV